jgi:hypothetical protein
MTLLETIGGWMLWLTGPFWLVWRRVSYACCYGYGRAKLTSEGHPDPDEKECFARGRADIMASAASTILQLQPKDVLARLGMLWAGLIFWRNQMRERRLRLWAGLWRGLKHDLALIGRWFHDPHRAWNYWRDERLTRKQMRRDAEDMRTLANITADPMHPDMDAHSLVKAENLKGWEMERMAIGRRIADPNQRTRDGDHLRHEHLGQLLARAYMDDPVAAKHVAQGLGSFGQQQMTRQGFFGAALATPFAGLMPQIAIGLAAFGVVGWGVAWERGLRLDHVQKDNEALKIERKALADNRAAWIAAYDKERAAALTAKAGATVTAQTIEAERLQRRLAAAKQRRLDDAARKILDGSPPDWGSLLDDGVRDETAADPVGLTPASGDAGDPGRMQP